MPLDVPLGGSVKMIPNRKVFARVGGIRVVTVRADRQVEGPPAKALAALATAGENEGYKVRDVRAKAGILLMSSGLRITGASLGFIVTARARRRDSGTLLSVDVTPLLGQWALGSARSELDGLLQEMQAVWSAPRARIRKPEKTNPGERPFGYLPQLLAAAWAGLSVLFYGFGFGGWLWVLAAGGIIGAVLALVPRPEPWWGWVVGLLALASLPWGVVGPVARRIALASQYWGDMVGP